MASFRDSRTVIGAASFTGMIVSAAAVFSVNPLLLKPMTEEFSWGRATLSSAYLVAAPVMAALFIVIGPMLDRYGVRRVLIPGYLLFGAGTALLSQLNGSVAQLLLLKIIVTAFSTAPTGVAFGKVISRHFTDRRGTMLGLCLGGGGGVGMMIMPLVAAHLLETGGWRLAYAGVGVVAALVGLTAALLLPDDAPVARADRKPAPDLPGIDGAIAWRTPTFILMMGSTLLACMVLNGTLAHMAAILTDSGLTVTQAAGAMSIYAFAMVCGQFGIGLVLDKWSSPRLAVPIFLTTLTGVALLHFSTAHPLLILGAACVGAGAGSEYGLLPYMTSRYFGLRSFGRLYGLIYSASAIGTGVGPFAMGLVFDLTGNYGRALYAFEAAILVVIALMLKLPAYTFAPDGTRSKVDVGQDAPTAGNHLEQAT